MRLKCPRIGSLPSERFESAGNLGSKAILLVRLSGTTSIALTLSINMRGRWSLIQRHWPRSPGLAQGSNVEERAKFYYLLAKIQAKRGDVQECLACLKRAKENGYRNLSDVY